MKLLITDDDGLIRDSLKIMLELEEGWSAKTAPDGNAAYDICIADPPDVILMDIRMPNCDGVAATKKIKTAFPQIKIVMLTTFTEDAYIQAAIEAGAEGYLLKSTPADGIVERIRAVEKGAYVFDKGVNISAKKAETLSFDKTEFSGRFERGSGQPENSVRLTQRENEVLSLVASGLSNNEIAAKLFLSQGTVRNIVSQLLVKLELRDRTQLAVYYWRNA
ncbi:MAG: response regulator transcription factor [Defluviitaleaceae bacterium]|nr:response regulator transcription factor [Defluviitaleaceae bacterium]